MSTRNVMTKQTALAKARERRRQLDRERGEQDERIETATAAMLLAIEGHAEAERALHAAGVEVGELLRVVLAEGVGVDRAAALLDLDIGDVRPPTATDRAVGSACERSGMVNRGGGQRVARSGFWLRWCVRCGRVAASPSAG